MDANRSKAPYKPAPRPEYAEPKSSFAGAEQLKYNVQRELDLARQIRAEAERYQHETETRARSQAQLLILQARLATQKEIAEIKRKATEEIQKVLADIRMIRIAAQEELEIQSKFSSAARIRALSFDIPKETREKQEKEVVKARSN